MKKLILVLLLIFTTIHFYGQSTKKIYGYVKGYYGQPIENSTVISQGKLIKTITDENGWYVISVPISDTMLSFKHKNYDAKIAALPVGYRLDVILISEFTSNDEINDIDFLEGIKIQKSDEKNAPVMYTIGPGVRMPDKWCTENYATITENGFRDAISSPLSTFSIDVDNASYSNIRRFINKGELPPIDAIRIEEMVNYFSYSYPEPTGKHPFSVYTELGICPWNKDNYLLHIGLKGKSIDKSELPASNLVFLIDVSGSMSNENKLPLLKKAFRMLVHELRPNDKVAIVVYAGAAGSVLPSTAGNEKSIIINSLDNLNAGGSTAGGEGIKLAYKIANENFIEGGNNRIILATDGDFNVGVSGTSEMARLVEKERRNGVAITVLGFGMGNIKDDKMETIADKGNGNYAYIDNIKEARKVFVTEFGGTLFTIAKDVKFQLEFNPSKVSTYRLVGYENRILANEDFNNDLKDAGEMGSGHTVTALYEIIPFSSSNNNSIVDTLKYQYIVPVKGTASDELLTIKVRYKEPDGTRSVLMEKPVVDILTTNVSDNFKFSSAVASFGMYLRGSEYMGVTSIESILKRSKSSKGADEEGYRSEFIQLVKTVSDLKIFDND
jgi:Ca-activated chloride channel homolog